MISGDGKAIGWPIEGQCQNLSIPETWASLVEFVSWYVKNGKPLLIPWNAPVIRTDDATAITVFRKGAFQVELYLIHPGKTIPVHSHPGMEVMTMTLGGGSVCGQEMPPFGTSLFCGRMAFLHEGEEHGGRPTDHGDGFLILSFERWLNDIKPTSAALQWKGRTAGELHDSLLEKHFPDQKVAGEFDVSATKTPFA